MLVECRMIHQQLLIFSVRWKASQSALIEFAFLERALYSFQQSFHPLFSIARGECRLEYRIQENRSFFICLFKNLIYIGERGCSRTALEFCKVLLR